MDLHTNLLFVEIRNLQGDLGLERQHLGLYLKHLLNALLDSPPVRCEFITFIL